MKKVNEYVTQLLKLTREHLRQQMKDDPNAYKVLMKNLLIQGLIKLMEHQVFIRCRKEDVAVVEEIKDEAIGVYRKLIVTEVKKFQGQDPSIVPCKIILDTSKYLESIEENEASGKLGGFMLFAKKGRIVCS